MATYIAAGYLTGVLSSLHREVVSASEELKEAWQVLYEL